MEALLLHPPFADPTQPYLSLPTLKGALRSRGLDARVVDADGTVIEDDRCVTPYRVSGCLVGFPHEENGVRYLRGASFVTRIEREDARWPLAEAPSPCPLCVAEGRDA